ncbi:aminotransferase class III-fold pyridoxal phosphate-dependent enzyme [Bradyrhizobium sp. 30]|uniref:aminotransferase class III-fold pyridoxal phosphate-dependent enzyme n=1 Tax=Bradyrhizobium sp. 30 TaxID=2782669 RepID=UPI003211A08E
MHCTPEDRTATFQGNDLALVSATAAMNIYWQCSTFARGIQEMGEAMRSRLETIASLSGNGFAVRGRGMAWGFDCRLAHIAEETTRKAFYNGLLIEQCRRQDQVAKFLPALTIDLATLDEGFEIFHDSLAETLK